MFTLTTIAPVSAKNSTQRAFNRTTGRAFVIKSNQAKKDHHRIQADAHEALARMPAWQSTLTGVLYPHEDLRVVLAVNMRALRMHVQVTPLWPRPKGFTGRKRDVHSHIDVLADALQGLVYANDNQIAELCVVRALGEE